MGNGLALLFKEAFPGNFAAYAAAVKRVEVQVAPHVRHGAGCSGRPPVSDQLPHQAALAPPLSTPMGRRWPAGSAPRHRREITLPPLGCGDGGLAWAALRPAIENARGALSDAEVWIYEPSEQYQNVSKRTGVVKLTPVRVLVAEMVRRHASPT